MKLGFLIALFVIAAILLMGQITTATAPFMVSRSGAITTGDLSQFNASGNLIDAGTTAATAGLSATGTISSGQILALNVTPVTVLAAQGAGTVIVIDYFAGELVFGGTAYAAGGTVSLKYNNVALTSNTCSAAFVTAAQNEYCLGGVFSTTSVSTASSIVNQPVTFSTGATAFTTGNGTINYYIKYRVLTGWQ